MKNLKNKTTDLFIYPHHLQKEYDIIKLLQHVRFQEDLTKIHITNEKVLDINFLTKFLCAVNKNFAIKELSFRANYIEDEHVEIIAKSFFFNNSIKYLDLSNNMLTDIGAYHLAQMIKANDSLDSINLSYNQIGNKGYKAIVESAVSYKNVNFSHNTQDLSIPNLIYKYEKDLIKSIEKTALQKENYKKNLCNDKAKGIINNSDGMLDEDIELNLKLIKENIKYHNKESEFYLEEKVLSKSNIVDSIKKWVKKDSDSTKKVEIQEGNSQKNFLSIVTIINEKGKKHALAMHIEIIGNLIKTSIIDPLSCDKSEFKKEITELQNKLSAFTGVSYQIYSGKQDDKSATCGDVSLFELFEILNNKIGIGNEEISNINDYIPSNTVEVYVNDNITYTLNEKLQAQTEYYLETGTVFETFRTAVESNQITVIQPQLSNNNESSLLVASDNLNTNVTNNYLYEMPSHLLALAMKAPSTLDIGLLRLSEHNVECAFNTADHLDLGNIIDYNMSIDFSYNFQGS